MLLKDIYSMATIERVTGGRPKGEGRRERLWVPDRQNETEF